MIIRAKTNAFFWLAGGAMALAGCGTGGEPVALLSKTSLTPTISNPFPATSTLTSFSAFGATQYGGGAISDGIEFLYSPQGFPVLAPVDGVITNRDANSITIFFNARFSVKVSNLSVIGPSVGQLVSGGSSGIGSTAASGGTGAVRITLFIDQNPACPFTYFDSALKGILTTALTNGTVNGPHTPCL